MSHTPGPWRISSDPRRITGTPYTFVATLDNQKHMSAETLAANASLIAAAPALLEALKLIRDTTETSAGYMRTVAEAAIMKAEGRS